MGKAETEETGHCYISARGTVTAEDPKVISLPESLRDDIQADLVKLASSDPIRLPDPEPMYQPNIISSIQERRGTDETFVMGITGKPRAGKDVAVDFIEAHYSGVKRLAFSDFIIAEVNDYLLQTGSRHRITAGNKSEPIYRKLLQDWGLGRRTNPDGTENSYWTDKVLERISKYRQDPSVGMVMITGVRTPGDFELIQEQLKSPVWEAVRPGNDYQAEHAVESAAAGQRIDFEIMNDVEGDLKPFEANIEKGISLFS
jgi:hypothetical protein